MLTNDDKKFILDTITFAITQNNKVLGKRFDSIDKRLGGVGKKFDLVNKRFDGVGKKFDLVNKRFDGVDKKFNLIDKSFSNLTEEMVEFFTITNKRIEEVNENLGEKIDKLSDKVDDINGVIVNHEHRIEKVEEKVFPISA